MPERAKKQTRKIGDGLSDAARQSLAAIRRPASRETIERFLLSLKSNGKKRRTIEIAATHLRFFANEIGKPLGRVTREDLERHLAHVVNQKTGEPAGLATLELRRGMLKQFYKWLTPVSGNPKAFPENVAWITSHRTPKERLSEDMLDKDEVRKLIEAANGTREKALVATLYESGTRIGEFLSLRIRDIKVKDGGYAVITLPAEAANLKTGRRQMPVVECVPFLQLWIEAHPDREKPSAFLWPSEYGKRQDDAIGETTVLKLLRRLAERAHIDKELTPHLLRHSRATECARRGWNESQMRRYFGWSRKSTMPSLYVHLAEGDVEARVLEDNGLRTKPAEQRDPMAPLVCGKCGRRNPATVVYCLGCAAVVNVEKAIELERKTEIEGRAELAVMANPQTANLVQKIAERLVAKALSSAARGVYPRPS